VTTPRRPGDPGFRPDLEGLRGVAILLVILCHAQVPGVEAGFIGVDIFFVLSGFLITGLLIGEHGRTRRIGLRAFYARRARRILPAAIVVLATTMLAASLLLSPLDLPRVGEDALAAGLSMANIRFALGATDYFAPSDASPLLHFWSLAVEEQFYLLWPVLLLVAVRLGRPRLTTVVLATTILVGSFVACLWLTDVSGPWAYFSLPTRAWQLAAGALLALTLSWHDRMPAAVAAGTGWLGIALIGAALLVIQPTTAYPGIASLLPTLAAVALIVSRGAVGSPGWLLLGRVPLRWLGRISYSLYLWHWPILILGPVALGTAMTEDGLTGGDLSTRTALIGVAVVVAAMTWRFVEEPFRRGPSSNRARFRGFALAGAATLVLVVGSTTMTALGARDVVAASAVDPQDQGAAMAATDPGPDSSDLESDQPVDPVIAPPTPTTVVGPASTIVPITPIATATPRPTARPPTARVDGKLPAKLTPTLEDARTDRDRLLADGCGLSLGGTKPPDCVYGDRHGTVTVALVGDSHAAHWFPALERIANARGWRLVPLTKFSCVFVDLPIWQPTLNREYTECEAWRENVVDRLVKLRPNLVIVASNQWLPVIEARDNDPERQGAALARLLKRIPGEKAIISDTPRSEVDVPACLAQHPKAIERCTTKQRAAFGWRHLRRETEAARLSGATLIDLSAAICPVDPCPPVIGNIVVYRDHHHLTATFVISIKADLEAALPAIP
jgi:peptidoglycan/LPS O-acetylase OafA/YrhL